jgi:hypothetical protein
LRTTARSWCWQRSKNVGQASVFESLVVAHVWSGELVRVLEDWLPNPAAVLPLSSRTPSRPHIPSCLSSTLAIRRGYRSFGRPTNLAWQRYRRGDRVRAFHRETVQTPARRPKCWASSSRFGGAKTGFAFCEGNDLALKRPKRSALSGAPASPKGICTRRSLERYNWK